MCMTIENLWVDKVKDNIIGTFALFIVMWKTSNNMLDMQLGILFTALMFTKYTGWYF